MLLTILLSCLHIGARGQTITSLDDLDLSGLPQPTTAKALRYWFDDDDGSVMTAIGLSGSTSIDVSGLIEGMHTLHYQVVASDDGVACISSAMFLKMEHGTSATARSLRYWFDDDNSNVKTATGTSGAYVLDASQLIEGLHTLHYQVTGSNDVLAYVGSRLFLKMNNKSDAATVKNLRYWFDDDNDNVKTIASGGVQTLDVSALLDGLHTIHYQVTSSDGMAAYVASGLFLKTGSSFEAENVKAQKLMYWFNDETVMQQADISEGAQLIDASGLIEGLHTLHYQVLCNNGQMTPAMSTLFLRVSADAETVVAKNLRYWFDDEQTATNAEITDGVQLLDASSLIEGLHTVHYQIEDSKGTLGAPYSSIFLKMNWDTSTTTAKALRYWYDDELTSTETAIANGTQTLDAARLIEGLHTVHYQIVDSNGTLGAPYSSVFLKMDASASTVAKSLRYWFDDDASTVTVTTVAGGTQTLDVSALPTGLHTLNYQLIDNNGKVGIPSTRLFLKNFDKVLSDGHNRVMKYQYWLNRNSQSMQTVELDAAANPYTLIALLPMQKEPIQSSQFHFEVTDGVPTIYAKNTLHVRFFDAQGYFTDGDKQFIDYQVEQEITDAEWLEPGVRATTAKPEENTIKWYSLEAEPGDSLQFKLDRAATIQLFAPSGEEVYSASGSEVVKLNGCHVKERGKYYLALHNVTATQGNTISIDYSVIGKYALLAYTPNRFSANGTTIMYLNGNGLTYVKSIELVNGDEVILPDTIVANTTDLLARFALNADNETAKTYTLNVIFNNEEENDSRTITRRNAITLEPANKGDITISIETERRVGDPYPIKVTMKNTGNVGYYGIPMNIAFDNPDKIDDFMFVNFDVSVSDSLFNEKELFALTDNLLGKQTKGFFAPLLVPYLGPNEEATFVFGIKTKIAHAKFNFYAWVGEPWYDGLTKDGTEGRYNAPRKAPCDISNIPEIARDINERTQMGRQLVGSATRSVGFGVGSGVAISGLMIGLTRHQASELSKTTGIPMEEMEQYRFHYRGEELLNGRNPWRLLNHPFEFLRPNGHAQSRQRRTSGSQGNSADDYARSGCPMPNPHPTDVYIPGDPNEMTGYIAESGSHHMTGDIKTVSYDIEFENAPELANSSAHSIVIENQLDPSVFDLNSFTPKDITISNKKVELSGEQSFVTTLDLRTAINVIAELRCGYNTKTGKIKWTMTSLDPMSMELTDDIMQGILPINNGSGDGIGHVTYSVNLLDGLVHGTSVNNKASIVFDSNDAIETPVWNNTVDLVPPESHVTDVRMLSDSTVSVSIEATDELSGPWRYNVYVQYGSGAWFLGAENVPIDTTASVKVYEGINHGFYVVVTDSAGNVEQKEAAREYTFEVFGSQIDTDTQIELAQGWNWISHNQQEPLNVEALKPAGSRMVGQTEELIDDQRLGWMGDLEELLPTQMYKLQMDEPRTIQLSGRLFNAGFRSVPLYEGWNWLGYPVAHTMTPAEALLKLEAEEGDMLVGQDGIATYSDGQWAGTLIEMQPGQGFMYRSASDKNLFYNATTQASSRRANARSATLSAQLSEAWTADKRKYPSVMGVIAQLWHDSEQLYATEWVLGAFCGEECRGVSSLVGEMLMMNVYGTGAEMIRFYVQNVATGEVLPVAETELFQADVLGTVQQPYAMHIGEPTGISLAPGSSPKGKERIYMLDGRRVDDSQLKPGVYVVGDGKKGKTQKIIRR